MSQPPLDLNHSPCPPVTPIDGYIKRVTGRQDIQLSLLRLDQLHPLLSGNKWFKLKYNLIAAKQQGLETLLSFGGAYSNHIHALAAAGHYYGFKTIGIIRGEAHYRHNPTLSDATNWGMKLVFVDRKSYRQKENQDYLEALNRSYGPAYLLPEGGTNALAIKGLSEIPTLIPAPDFWITACGTGGTLSGLIQGATAHSKILGIAVLNDQATITETVKRHVTDERAQTAWELNSHFTFGGYAKYNEALIDFIDDFEAQTGIPLDPVYTGKMLYALINLIQAEFFPPNSQLVALHTGGLQGRRGFSHWAKAPP